MQPDDDHIAALYRASRERLAPSHALDERILAEARRAVGARRRWHYPSLALAATLLLGVGLSWIYLAVPPPSLDDGPAFEAERADETRAPAVLSGSVQYAPAPAKASAPPAPPASRAREPAVEAMGKAAVQARRKAETVSADAAADCVLPPQDAAETVWIESIETARERGDNTTADCLEAAYRKRFARP